MDNNEKIIELMHKIAEIESVRDKYIEKVNKLNEEFNQNKGAFYSNSIKMDTLGGCLYQINECEKKIKKLKELQQKIVKKENKKRQR